MRATSKRQSKNRPITGDLQRGKRGACERVSAGAVLAEPSNSGTATDDIEASSEEDPVAVDAFRGDYWQQSRRPLVSLAFVVPLLLIYEAGILWLGPQAMRNGADVWLRQLLDLLGF